MVHGDQQRMLVVGQLNQTPADQRTGFKIERRRGLFCDLPHKFLFVASAQIVLEQQETAVFDGHNPLHRLLAQESKGAAQSFMTRHDAVQGTANSRPVQLPSQAQSERYMIGRADALHLRQEPQPLLRKRQRQRATARNGNNRWQLDR